MLKDGEKGAILQRDKTTYAIVPHTSLGLITPDDLRRIAMVTEKYGAQGIKITSATRIAIVGLREEDIDRAWADLGLPPGAAVGLCVRSVKACPGTTFCRLGQQDSLAVAGELDKRHHGRQLPGKFKIGVAGCVNQCSETCIKDLGLVGKKDGWTVMVGGNGGSRPQLAETIAEGLSDADALALADRIVGYFEENAKKMDRMSKLLKRVGMDAFKEAVL